MEKLFFLSAIHHGQDCHNQNNDHQGKQTYHPDTVFPNYQRNQIEYFHDVLVLIGIKFNCLTNFKT